VLGPGLELDLGLAVFEQREFEAQVMHERDVDPEVHL
jgi:hypothetical protein